MKYFVLLTGLIFVCYLLGFIKKPEKYQWMDRNYTTAIKGFSIWTVVWAHSGAMLSVGGIQFVAGIGVALFLMCSGYGLEISYEKNGLISFWKKRLLGVCLPFWIVELVGLLATGVFSIKTYLLDFCFLKSATSYGWFMTYIVICYLIFYAVKRLIKDVKIQMLALFGAFAIWFVLESMFFANPDMPFLRAMQMLSFPVGVLLAANKNQIDRTLTKTKNILILTGGGTVCLLFMAITQLHAVKNLPYIVSNVMALLTCLPMAIGIMVFGKSFSGLFENKMLATTGMISYEIYLVHAFTLGMIKPSVVSVIAFVVVTVTLAYGDVVTFKNDFSDNNNKSLEWWINKHNWYSNKEVLDQQMKSDAANGEDSVEETSTSMQAKVKRFVKNHGYYSLPKFFRAHLYFIYRYYLRLGFLDGTEGKIYTFLQAYWYRYLVDAKLYECEKLGVEMKSQGDLKA